MFRGMSALDLKWLARILLKKMKLGIGERRILDAYHSRAFGLYTECSNLSAVCEAIDSDNIPVANGSSNGIFQQISPMLCERCEISDLHRIVAAEDCVFFLETKMDGERCQIHVNTNADANTTEFKYFFRGNTKYDLENMFGTSSNADGKFSQFFRSRLNKDMKNAIFDGEMMVWD